MTVSEALHECGLPRIEADMLMAFATGKSRTWMFAHSGESLSEGDAKAFLALVARRRHGEPVAYLLGHRSFWTLELAVAPGVLIPRGDTELLVEKTLELTAPMRAPQILELGTGSGAIALAIASERPSAQITATDVDATALNIAQQNAVNHDISNVTFSLSPWFQNLSGQRFNTIVSNPPYIPENDPHLLQGDLRFEPRHALASGEDGLNALREITANASGHLLPAGWLLVEHGFDQGEQVRSLFENAGFAMVDTHSDLQGHPRVTVGRCAA